MQQEKEKYDPVILNLSKSQEIKHPKNYFWLFLSSVILLGVLLVSMAWYIFFHTAEPGSDGGTSRLGGKATAVAEATPAPTPVPSVTPTPTITPAPEKAATIPAEPQNSPEAKQMTGFLSLNSFPEQADVMLGSERLGQTPLEDYELKVGDYSVTFSYNGQNFTYAFSIKAGEHTEYTHRFEGFGSLQINTTSSGCEVYVNGKLRGESPLLIEGLSPGDYTLVLKKVGYHTTEEHISLGKGEHKELFLTIKRLGSRSSSGTTDSPSRPLHPSERLRN